MVILFAPCVLCVFFRITVAVFSRQLTEDLTPHPVIIPGGILCSATPSLNGWHQLHGCTCQVVCCA